MTFESLLVWAALGFAILGMGFSIAGQPVDSDAEEWNPATLCWSLSAGFGIGWFMLVSAPL